MKKIREVDVIDDFRNYYPTNEKKNCYKKNKKKLFLHQISKISFFFYPHSYLLSILKIFLFYMGAMYPRK